MSDKRESFYSVIEEPLSSAYSFCKRGLDGVSNGLEDILYEENPTSTIIVRPPENESTLDFTDLMSCLDQHYEIENEEKLLEDEEILDTSYSSADHLEGHEAENFFKAGREERVEIDIYGDWEQTRDMKELLEKEDYRIEVDEQAGIKRSRYL